MRNEINPSFLNNVKKRFLPLPRSAAEGLEHEANKSDFEFIKELGVGSFGQVYLVKHKKTKAIYAIKSIDKRDEQNLEEKANFAREVEIMYKLHHPNIVKLYGHFEDNDYCYFIMQYIPKRSVYEIIPKIGKKPNLKLIASVMKDLISAVYYLHNMKPIIIHRDIKPENILLDENSRAYLTDFGWSNYVQSFKRRTTVCGTPLYLPPEMINEVGHDEKADIWCIGVLLFELTAGKVPFEGRDLDTVKRNILKLNISWPREMDDNAKDLISKILRLNPKERLPIEKILSHPFFTQYFPNATNELMKPEHIQNKIFVVSVDDPITWGEVKKNPPIITNKTSGNTGGTTNYTKISPTKSYSRITTINTKTKNNTNSNTNTKVNININNNRGNQRIRNAYVPKTHIDLSSQTNKISINNRRITQNINHGNNNSYAKVTRRSNFNSSNLNANNNTYNRNSIKNNEYDNTSKNLSKLHDSSFRNSNTNNNSYSITTSYTSNNRDSQKYISTNSNYRNSGKNSSIIINSRNINKNQPTTNSNVYPTNTFNSKNNYRMSFKRTQTSNALTSHDNNNSINNNYRMSFRLKNHVNYYSNSNSNTSYNPNKF